MARKIGYLVLYVILLLLIIINGVFDYNTQKSELLHLLRDQAHATGTVIRNSGQQQLRFSEEIKKVYTQRAFDFLNIINQLDLEGILTEDRLLELARKSSIFQATIFNEKAETVFSTQDNSRNNRGRGRRYGFVRRLEPIFNGEVDTLIFGTGQNPWRDNYIENEYRFVVSIRRSLGGVIACHLSIEAEKQFKISTSLNSTLNEMLNVEGISYILLAPEDGNDQLYSKSLLSVSEEKEIIEAFHENAFLVIRNNETYIEIMNVLQLSDVSINLYTGFSTDHYNELKSKVMSQIIIRSTLFTIAVFLLFFFFISRQNVALLKQEKIRIEGEVEELHRVLHVQEKQVAMGKLAAGIAHEIRNPLNAIGIQVQRLNRNLKKDGTNLSRYELSRSVIEEIQRIDQTLEDFLSYARPTPLEMSTIDIQRIVTEVISILEGIAIEKGLHFERGGNESISIHADPNYMKQALMNIVKNAIEASTQGGKIQLNVDDKENEILISVSDEGTGIDKESLDRVFDLYYTTKDMGTGVGLSITQKIVADHGGSITIDSVPDKGSTFTITLPRGRV